MNLEQTEERFHPDDIVNDILFVEKHGMGIDPAKRSPEYIKKLEEFAKEQREKKNNLNSRE